MSGLLNGYFYEPGIDMGTAEFDPMQAYQAQASLLGQQGAPQQAMASQQPQQSGMNWGGGSNLWPMLMSLGAGIASGGAPGGGGWGGGIGKGLALGQNQMQLSQNNDYKKLMLAIQMKQAEAMEGYRNRQLEQGDERNAIARTAAERSGIPSGFAPTEGGGLVPIPGGPHDPKVIAEQSLARGRGADVPQSVRTDAIKADQAYTNITTALDDYEKTVKRTGNVLLPGKDKDEVNQKRRNIQLQLKELFNLGVLNGPDLALMDSMLFDPNASLSPMSGNFGAALDTGDRVNKSVSGLKEMLRGIRNSKTKAIGMPDVEASKEPAIGEEVDPFGIR